MVRLLEYWLVGIFFIVCLSGWIFVSIIISIFGRLLNGWNHKLAEWASALGDALFFRLLLFYSVIMGMYASAIYLIYILIFYFFPYQAGSCALYTFLAGS